MSYTEGKVVYYGCGRTVILRPDGQPARPPDDAEQFLLGLERDFARLALDPVAFADYQREMQELEGTIADGLEEQP